MKIEIPEFLELEQTYINSNRVIPYPDFVGMLVKLGLDSYQEAYYKPFHYNKGLSDLFYDFDQAMEMRKIL